MSSAISTLTVRFLTRRFIGDYDPDLEKIYSCTKCLVGNSVDCEILDTAGQNVSNKLKQHVKWCDAVILMYSVADRCSFNEARRLNFTVTANIRRRYKPGSDPGQEPPVVIRTPVCLVGNMSDRQQDRMVTPQEGREMATELGCVSFAELSVREDIEPVMEVFEDLYLSYRRSIKLKSPVIAAGSLSLLHRDHQLHHQHIHSPNSWLSLERLALGNHNTERKDATSESPTRSDSDGGGGGGGSDDEPTSTRSPRSPASPGFRTRRREALLA